MKHFRAHLGNVQHLAANYSGTRLVSLSNDKALKVFDVENFGESLCYSVQVLYVQFVVWELDAEYLLTS